MQLAPLICVHDVPATSAWYQQLIGCTRGHGGDEYERLMAGGQLVLQLHFELPDFDAAVRRAVDVKMETLKGRRLSENGNWEFWLRDPDGYTVVLTSPLP